jgi:hypothetical protein
MRASPVALEADYHYTYLQRGADDVDGSPSFNFVLGEKFLEYIVSATVFIRT